MRRDASTAFSRLSLAGVPTLREAKAGGRVHPIGALCIAFLDAMPRAGDWVVPGRNQKQPLSIYSIEHA